MASSVITARCFRGVPHLRLPLLRGVRGPTSAMPSDDHPFTSFTCFTSLKSFTSYRGVSCVCRGDLAVAVVSSNTRGSSWQGGHILSKTGLQYRSFSTASGGNEGENNDSNNTKNNSKGGGSSSSSSSSSSEVNNNTLRNRNTNSSKINSSNSGLTGVEQWIARFNSVIGAHPMVSVGVFTAMQASMFWGLAAAYGFSSSFGPELGIAYLISKTISRFRQPLNIGIAAVLSKQVPVLSQFKISPLLGLGLAPKPISPHLGGGTSMFDKFNAWIEKPFNQYGMSYYIAARSTSLITLTSVTAALKSGVDISSFLEWVGVSETLQAGGSALGAAAITSIFLTPVLFIALPKVVTKCSEMLEKSRGSKSKSKNDNDDE